MRALIAAQRRKVGKSPPWEYCWQTSSTGVTRGDNLSGLSPPSSDEPLKGLAAHQRLVGKHKHNSIASPRESLDSSANGTRNALLPVSINQGASATGRQGFSDCRRMRAQYNCDARTE